MKTWHAGLLGLALTGAFALSANAADFYRGGLKDGPPPPPVYGAPPPLWTGFYIGVNGGYGWNADDSGWLDPSGGFGGGQIGYNWQGLFGASPIVLGIETDFQGAGISDSDRWGELSLNWFGTVRGRLGYAIGPTLIYATGGFAYGEVESSGSWNASETQTGYVVGGGVEYKFNPAWSVKAEYQFLSLAVDDWNNGPGSLSASEHNDRSEVNTVRVGVNYHFGQNGFGPLH